mmetsp:Transcript_86/g.401  ORF Transcript_86/g.401 Transcript_86/m.401 type:complete len:734 (+) Transcript_86:390-2591(+)
MAATGISDSENLHLIRGTALGRLALGEDVALRPGRELELLVDESGDRSCFAHPLFSTVKLVIQLLSQRDFDCHLHAAIPGGLPQLELRLQDGAPVVDVEEDAVVDMQGTGQPRRIHHRRRDPHFPELVPRTECRLVGTDRLRRDRLGQLLVFRRVLPQAEKPHLLVHLGGDALQRLPKAGLLRVGEVCRRLVNRDLPVLVLEELRQEEGVESLFELAKLIGVRLQNGMDRFLLPNNEDTSPAYLPDGEDRAQLPLLRLDRLPFHLARAQVPFVDVHQDEPLALSQGTSLLGLFEADDPTVPGTVRKDGCAVHLVEDGGLLLDVAEERRLLILRHRLHGHVLPPTALLPLFLSHRNFRLATVEDEAGAHAQVRYVQGPFADVLEKDEGALLPRYRQDQVCQLPHIRGLHTLGTAEDGAVQAAVHQALRHEEAPLLLDASGVGGLAVPTLRLVRDRLPRQNHPRSVEEALLVRRQLACHPHVLAGDAGVLNARLLDVALLGLGSRDARTGSVVGPPVHAETPIDIASVLLKFLLRALLLPLLGHGGPGFLRLVRLGSARHGLVDVHYAIPRHLQEHALIPVGEAMGQLLAVVPPNDVPAVHLQLHELRPLRLVRRLGFIVPLDPLLPRIIVDGMHAERDLRHIASGRGQEGLLEPGIVYNPLHGRDIHPSNRNRGRGAQARGLKGDLIIHRSLVAVAAGRLAKQRLRLLVACRGRVLDGRRAENAGQLRDRTPPT